MSLHVIVGPMFAGKSTELIRTIEREIIARRKACIFKPDIDGRYGLENVVAHNKLSHTAVVVKNDKEGVMKILEMSREKDVVGIDEIQFFPKEILFVCDKLLKDGKRVIVSGLNLDFRSEPFEIVKELLIKADSIKMLNAICSVCGADASRSQRLLDGKPAPYNSPVIAVGGLDLYEARCRKCYIEPKKD